MKKTQMIILTCVITCLFLLLTGFLLYYMGVFEILPQKNAPLPQAAVTAIPQPTMAPAGKTPIVVLDPGHGKPSSAMTEAEKEAGGWLYSPQQGGWGEWRHWKSHTTWQDCAGTGCSMRAPSGGGCWYPIGSGDRDTEPDINLQNAQAAKTALEQLGYTVRMTRTSSAENPSMTNRLTHCYPNQDTTQPPDADLFICIHSNAGGGRGSYYIELSGIYDQAGIPDDYAEQGNQLGQAINQQIVAHTSLSANQGGVYSHYPELVLFCKSPIPIAYLEIGFFDHPEDLRILQTESQLIGRSIAEGIDTYWRGTHGNL